MQNPTMAKNKNEPNIETAIISPVASLFLICVFKNILSSNFCASTFHEVFNCVFPILL